jgi:hypothetical protein
MQFDLQSDCKSYCKYDQANLVKMALHMKVYIEFIGDENGFKKLKKAYDSIDWEYLKLILLIAGFGTHLTDWIMSEKGLRQGFPLSPCLFILIMEGLTLMFKKSISKEEISGIKVTNFINIVHIMFVDGVLILSKANITEWTTISSSHSYFVWVLR